MMRKTIGFHHAVAQLPNSGIQAPPSGFGASGPSHNAQNEPRPERCQPSGPQCR